MPDPPSIASPLPYLFAEAKHADRQAREALFCTFNADLGYFERTVLGVTQAAGARVTVVADARVSDPDPRAARNAGTRYVYGLAVPAADAVFHPKVTVIAGPERAVVAVGSGNLSTGGWHLNRETWTVATADRDQCPALVPQLAGWLAALDQMCTITPQARQGLRRTAARLEELAAAGTVVDTGHRFVHNLTSSLISQLPDTRASRLLVYAPFHDERAEAIRHLVERLHPGRVSLAVQSGERTVIQPEAVARLVADLDVGLDIIVDPSPEYRHGKLVEAVGPDGDRWALTGSANLSAQALLHSAASGGNVEAGILSRPDASLFPEGDPASLAEVPAVRIPAPAARHAEAGLPLLAAVRTQDGLQVTLAKPSSVPVRVLASSQASFDAWTEVGTVPAGTAEHVLSGTDLPGGTRVRGRRDTAAGPVDSGIIFVTDPALVLKRPGESGPRPGHTSSDPIALISDPRLLDMWTSAISQLAATRAATAVPRPAGPGAPRGETGGPPPGGGLRVDTEEERWLAYADDAKARLGPDMFRFALGGFRGMRVTPVSAQDDLQEPTDRLISERAPGFDDDQPATVDDEPGSAPGSSEDPPGNAEEPVIPDARGWPARERHRIQQVLRELVATETRLPVIDRLAVISLILCTVQAGIWDGSPGSRGWMHTLGEAVGKLDQDDIPGQISRQAASLAALAVYLMHEFRPGSDERDAAAGKLEEATRQSAHLYPDADPALVTDYAAPFTNKNGYPIDPDAVMHVITMIVQGDPLAEVVHLLESRHPGWRIDRHDDVLLHVDGEFRGTFLPAAEALEAMAPDGRTAVWATGRTPDWTLVSRHDGTLIRVEKRQARITWWHHRLNNRITPTGIARSQELANLTRIPHGPLNRTFPEAHELLAAIGFDITGDPPSDCARDAAMR